MGWLRSLPGFSRRAAGRLLERARAGANAQHDIDDEPGELGARVAAIALGQVGVREDGGRNRGKRVDEYIRAAGADPSDGPAWCMMFVHWLHFTAAAALGIDNPCPRTWGAAKGWIAAGAKGYTRILPADVLEGRATLLPGDVAVWARVADGAAGARAIRRDNRRKGHTGVVVAYSGGEHFDTVEGNTIPDSGTGDEARGQGVHRKRRGLRDAHLVGFWRPTT